MSDRKLARMKPEEIQARIDKAEAASQVRAAALRSREERLKIAEWASKELDYPHLKHAVEGEAVDDSLDVSFIRALNRIGIRPFDYDSVEDYMRRHAANRLNAFMKGLGILLLLGGGGGTIGSFSWGPWPFTFWQWVPFGFFAVGWA